MRFTGRSDRLPPAHKRMNLDAIFGSLDDNDSRDGLDPETLAEIAAEAAIAHDSALAFMRKHPEFLQCKENSVAFVKELLWLQNPPTLDDFEKVYEKLRAAGKVVIQPEVRKVEWPKSAFTNAARDLEELEPVGSMEWYRSWLNLRRETEISLKQEFGDELEEGEKFHPNLIADAMVELSCKWFHDECLSVMCGERRPRYLGVGYAPPMPIELQREFEEFVQKLRSEDQTR
jgi:hypothetical protein